MATGDSLSADQVTIWFAPVDVLGSELAADAKAITTFVSNFDESGGARETESVPHFGNANVTRRKPREQKELSFDVTLRYGSDSTIFNKIEDRAVIGPDGAGSDFVVGSIVIQSTDGSNYYWRAFNNVDAVNFDGEFSAEEEWKGTINFKLAPTDETGTANIKYGNTSSVASELTSWS